MKLSKSGWWWFDGGWRGFLDSERSPSCNLRWRPTMDWRECVRKRSDCLLELRVNRYAHSVQWPLMRNNMTMMMFDML